MGNGQIGYDISPIEALDEMGMQYPKDKQLQETITGIRNYIQHLENEVKK